MNKKMKKLCKDFDCTTPKKYYKQLTATFQNGNKADAREMYQELPNYYKQEFVKILNTLDLSQETALKLIIHINKR